MRSVKAKWFEYGPMGGVAGWRRGIAIAAAAAVFLAVSGAFGMSQTPLGVRLAYWAGMLTIGTVWGGVILRLVFPARAAASNPWLRTILYALVIAGPLTGLVWLVNGRLLHAPIPLRALASLFVSVALVTLMITAVNVLAGRRRGRGRTDLRRACAAPLPRAAAGQAARRRDLGGGVRGPLPAAAHLAGPGPDPDAAERRRR